MMPFWRLAAGGMVPRVLRERRRRMDVSLTDPLCVSTGIWLYVCTQ